MRLGVPDRLRYNTLNRLQFRRSPVSRGLLRSGLFIVLIAAAAPWRVTREVAFGIAVLKPSVRAMLWIWNRSWVPIKFPVGTFFDIGWVLSEESCEALQRRNFVSKTPLKRECDLAQLKLSSIRAAIQAGDHDKVERADRELMSLVGDVFDTAREWAAAAPLPPTPAKVTSKQPESTKDEKSFDNEATKTALFDFDDLCGAIGQTYFLVSGTFLGAVREGGFIGHDHDIDVGIFEDELLDSLVPALDASEKFSVSRIDHVCLRESDSTGVRYTRMGKPVLIRFVHVTGVAFDGFVHFHDGDLVWHGTREQRWDNRRFELRDYEFLGRKLKGPADFDLYLTENYGPEWRVPKANFDTNVDTPNIGYVGSANGLVFWAWMVARAVAEGKVARARKFLEMLAATGAVKFRLAHARA